MKEQLIQEVQRQMLPFLNNAQLKQLQSVLEGVLSGVELSHSAGMVESAKVDTVACFINAKRIEGCSEKTLSYYRQTIVSMPVSYTHLIVVSRWNWHLTVSRKSIRCC